MEFWEAREVDAAAADAGVNHALRVKTQNKLRYEGWTCSRIGCGKVWLFAGVQGQKKVGDNVHDKKHASENNSIQDTVAGHLTVSGGGLGTENKEILHPWDPQTKEICEQFQTIWSNL